MVKRIAIITARGGSKRIPRKNIREFCGKPIIHYAITAAIESGLFEEVMVSTDDHEIASIAKASGAVVPFMRSAENSNDFASTLDVIKEVLHNYQTKGRNFDEYCCIYPTAPFLTAGLFQQANSEMAELKANGLVPVVRFSYPIQRALQMVEGRISFVTPEYAEKRSQDLEPRYHDVGQFYMGRVDHVMKCENLFDGNVAGFEIDELRVQDIDCETDWKIAEIKFKLLTQEGLLE